MAKEAYYFSHDANARQDPKVLEMMSVYGLEGYGRYWVLVEMLREQSDFTLKLSGKYTFNALAMQMQCTADASEKFVHDCIKEFGLFESDGEHFWSNSLIRRMAIKEEISIKRKKAAEARWGKKTDTTTNSEDEDTNDMQMHSKSNANGMQGKEKKVKESKESKDKPVVQQTELFESWWNLYDNKKGKVKCETKYKSLLKKYSHESIMTGTQNYIDYRKKLVEAKEFLPQQKQPLTFLNGEHFNDEYEEIRKGGDRSGIYQQPAQRSNDASGIDW